MLKHLIWRYQEEKEWKNKKGRLGIYLEKDRIEIKQLFGPALPAELLYELLKVLEVYFIPSMEKFPYLVECRKGISGSCDYLKRILVDEKFQNAPITSGIHVSMYGKLNEGVKSYINDLHIFISEFPEVFGKNLEFYDLDFQVIEEDELFNLEDFIYPE